MVELYDAQAGRGIKGLFLGDKLDAGSVLAAAERGERLRGISHMLNVSDRVLYPLDAGGGVLEVAMVPIDDHGRSEIFEALYPCVL